ncbi:MAG: CYTH domain-containing protein [Candidatus Liptonbacteria bacterium]
MIEVEKNYNLKPGDKERLTADAEFLYAKAIRDIYYDSPDWKLTRRDHWLRERNGRFELKVPLNNKPISERETDQYRELETDAEIARELELDPTGRISEEISEKGYVPFVTIVTQRESYRKGDFHLDFDEMDFGFSTFEAELLVEKEEDMRGAEKRINEFARQYGVSGTTGRGKVIECLFRHAPEHYRALVSAGVIKE